MRAKKITQADKDGFDEKQKTYVTSLAKIGAVGIVPAVLLLVVYIFFCVCRVCCGKCGGRKAKDTAGDVEAKGIMVPGLFFALSFVGVIVTVIVAYVMNTVAGTGIDNTLAKYVFCESSRGLDSDKCSVSAPTPPQPEGHSAKCPDLCRQCIPPLKYAHHSPGWKQSGYTASD